MHGELQKKFDPTSIGKNIKILAQCGKNHHTIIANKLHILARPSLHKLFLDTAPCLMSTHRLALEGPALDEPTASATGPLPQTQITWYFGDSDMW